MTVTDKTEINATVRIAIEGGVGLIELQRPKALNAIDRAMAGAIIAAAERLAADPGVGALVISGCERAFAAGADIRELREWDYDTLNREDRFVEWERFAECRLPKIAACDGYILGGGCELALMCDLIFASPRARFGQPEIDIGTIPGMGGTQRLTRLVGRALAMDMVLTGRQLDAEQALRAGLVSRVIEAGSLLEESLGVARRIASRGRRSVLAARECVAMVDEMPLSAGLRFERRAYHALWQSADLREGMAAFLDKREPHFEGG